MSDHTPHHYSKVIIASSLVAAGISCVFGFIGGYLGSDAQLRDQIIASLMPGLARRSAPLESSEPQGKAEDDRFSDEQNVIGAVKSAAPAVVSIDISKDVPTYEVEQVNPFGNNEFFNQFFGGNVPGMTVPQYRQNGTEKKQVGSGSGFIVSADGYIVTNKHVVADEKAEYVVQLADDRKFDAKVLARDPFNDIAVLKIEAVDLPVIPFADSDALQVGQKTIAIGYALGRFTNSVSTGIVSGLQRSIDAVDKTGNSENLFDVIQTDAAINPGNSGGPLLDSKGRAIGMSVAMVQGSQSIGFAVTAKEVRKAYEEVKKSGKISGGAFLGVRYLMINEQVKQQNQLPVDQGALIARGQNANDLAVMPSSPADLAGLVENDIILEVNGQKLSEDYPLVLAIRKFSPGDEVQFKVLHKGKEKIVEVTLTERK